MVTALSIQMKTSSAILHESRWAISKKCGSRVHKIFLHDAYSKIRKEVSLLQLSLGKEIDLSFDSSIECWVSKSDYMRLWPIIGNIDLGELIAQLKTIFDKWKDDKRYHELISDEWSNTMIPWYCTLLQRYIPASDEAIDWLQHSCAEHFIHGDFTLSNIYLDQSNNVIVLDYENATIGPLLWDETTLVYSFIEQKQFNVARQFYDTFSCNKEMLRAICSVRLAQSIRKKQDAKQRIEAY